MKEKPKEFNTLLSDSKQHRSELMAVFIIEVVRMFYGLEQGFETTRNRQTDIVLARQMAMYMIRRETSLSLKNIGRLFKKDHATVLHSVNAIKNYLFYDKKIKESVKDIQKIVDFKSVAINENADWKRDYYYIDMDNFSSLKFKSTEQSIIMTGFTNDEVYEFSKMFKHFKSVRHHNKTGMYVLEKIIKKETENGN